MILATRVSRALKHAPLNRLISFVSFHSHINSTTTHPSTRLHFYSTLSAPKFSMSDSEGENFDVDFSDSESDSYEPAPKKVRFFFVLSLIRKLSTSVDYEGKGH